MAYLVIDTRTGATVARCASKQAARNQRDRLGAACGAGRDAVREGAAGATFTGGEANFYGGNRRV